MAGLCWNYPLTEHFYFHTYFTVISMYKEKYSKLISYVYSVKNYFLILSTRALLKQKEVSQRIWKSSHKILHIQIH